MVEKGPNSSPLSTEVLRQEVERFQQAKIEATETGGEVIVKVGEERYSVTDPKRAGRQITRLP